MIPIVTSFSPNPKDADRQVECCRSWLSQGFDVFAVQGQDESLPSGLGAVVSRGPRIYESGPPRLVHLLRQAATIEGALILNSDLEMLPGFFDAIQQWATQTHGQLGSLWLRRWNYAPDSCVAPSREKWGIDAFAVRPSTPLLEFFDALDLRIGRPGWDYVLPYWFLLRGLPLWTIDDPPLLLHRDHAIRWSHASWEQNTILGAKALGLAPTVQLQTLSQQLNRDIDKYSKRLALSIGEIGPVDSPA